jgi:hypothetical protein
MPIHILEFYFQSWKQQPTNERNIHSWYSNIYPTRCKVTQFILSGICSTCFGWYIHPSSGARTTVSTTSGICHTVTVTCRLAAGSRWQIQDAVDTVDRPPNDGWRYHPKHVKQIPDKINCVTLHLVGYMFEYSYDARTHERQTLSKFKFWTVVFLFPYS